MSGREHTRNRHCQQESYGRPDCGKKYATSNHQSEDISFLRPECYSQSDLLSPLLHHMRDYAVDTCSSERSEEHTSELQSPDHLVCRLLLEKKKKKSNRSTPRERH